MLICTNSSINEHFAVHELTTHTHTNSPLRVTVVITSPPPSSSSFAAGKSRIVLPSGTSLPWLSWKLAVKTNIVIHVLCCTYIPSLLRTPCLQNDLYCVEWDVKL